VSHPCSRNSGSPLFRFYQPLFHLIYLALFS
jgi:hypothetical protein